MSDKLTWNEVWFNNYSGLSDIAKAIITKANYKGNKYIPWAVMERALYALDNDGTVDPVVNFNGGFVFSETFELPTVNKEGVQTVTLAVSHFVKAKCLFMGKTFYESFPLQDNSYNAVRVYDQNIVNKAIQRAKAKVISRATGIGWALYESGDLQYELDGAVALGNSQAPVFIFESSTPMPTPEPIKTKAVTAEASKKVEEKDHAEQILALLKDESIPKETMEKMLSFINNSLNRSYGLTLAVDSTKDQVDELVSKLAKPEVLIKSIKTQLGVK